MIILLAGIIVHAYFNLDKKEQVNILFFRLMFLMLIILFLEILSVILNSVFDPRFITPHKMVDMLGFTLTPLVPIHVVLYVYKRINPYQRVPKNKLVWLSAPLIVNSVLSLGSYHYNWIFRITAQNVYLRGPLWSVSPLSCYFYYILNLVILYNNRKKINREELFTLSLLSVIPGTLSFIQLFYFVYLTIWNSVAIAVMINYVFIINNQTMIDPLTKLGNRLAYSKYIASLRGNDNIVLSVVNIDLDGFKTINDLWGHHQGDEVLKAFAKQLKNVFEDGVLIRWGGDEFIVLLHENRREVLEKYLKTLSDRINKYNDRNDLPYKINFSYGIAIFNNAYQSIDDLIQHSDKLMYEEKQKKKRPETYPTAPDFKISSRKGRTSVLKGLELGF